jgi:heat shock protein HslJ
MKKFRLFEIISGIVLVSLTVFSGISCAQAASTGKLEGVSWVLKSYGDPGSLKIALTDKETTLIFDKAKKEASGNGGVNGYGGKYEINGSRLTVSNIIHTEMASTNNALNIQESTFFKILESAQNYKINGQELTITGTEGTLVFTQK